MTAFRSAYELGYRYLETDVHLTADGVVVAFHDPGLARVAGIEGSIATNTWDELAEVDIGDGERIPRLGDLLDAFPDARFNIDAKSDAVATPLVEIVREHEALDRVLLASFSDRRVARMHAHADGRVCTSFGRTALAASLARSLRFPLRLGAASALQLPYRVFGRRFPSATYVDWAHREGLDIHAWTVDGSEDMHRLLDLGVDGIMTDRPSVLKAVFEERGLSVTPPS